MQEAQAFRDLPPVARSLWIETPRVAGDDRSALYRILISVGSFILVLMVISFGMALWAAEGRDEQQMLSAIGASPGMLTRMTAWRSMILTMAGVSIAVPLGYGTILIIAATGTRYDNAPFPWLVASAILLAIPLIVTGVSYAGSAISRRARRRSFSFSE